MKYFTPELFVAFNSDDEHVANDAALQWDQAVSDYDGHLKSIRRRFSRNVRELSRLNLHDADYLEYAEDSPSGQHSAAHLTVRQNGEVIVLLYFLREEPRITAAKNRIFSEQSVHWLYDEVDAFGPEDFSHEILLSNGRMLRFRFRHLSILKVATDMKRPKKTSRRTECA